MKLFLLVFALDAQLNVTRIEDCRAVEPSRAQTELSAHLNHVRGLPGAVCQQVEGMMQHDCMTGTAVIQIAVKNDLQDCRATPERIQHNIKLLQNKKTTF